MIAKLHYAGYKTARLSNSHLGIEAQKPTILPRDHRLTEIVHHGGVRTTLTELRSRFWVPKGRQTIKKLLKKCVTCKRWQGSAYNNPKTAALPEFRAKEAALFSKVGIDFAGPLCVKDFKSKDMRKVYIAIFPCCVTILVEIEGYECNDAESEPLTPSHLMFGRRIKSLPDVQVEEEAESQTSCGRFRHLSIRLAHFWKKWRNEYLSGLREYHKPDQM